MLFWFEPRSDQAHNGKLRKWVGARNRLMRKIVDGACRKWRASRPYPQALMTVGLGRGDAERAGFLEADLVIAAGYDPVEWGPRTWNPRRQAQIVHLDFTSAEVDAHCDPAVEVVADVRETLELVAPADRQPPAKARGDDRCQSDAFPLLPERVLAAGSRSPASARRDRPTRSRR